jgi:hypothetical protein
MGHLKSNTNQTDHLLFFLFHLGLIHAKQAQQPTRQQSPARGVCFSFIFFVFSSCQSRPSQQMAPFSLDFDTQPLHVFCTTRFNSFQRMGEDKFRDPSLSFVTSNLFQANHETHPLEISPNMSQTFLRATYASQSLQIIHTRLLTCQECSEIFLHIHLLVKSRLVDFGGNMQSTQAHTPSLMITKLQVAYINDL